MEVKIRELSEADHSSWLKLWAGYLSFYKVEIPDSQTSLTWARLLDADFDMHGLIAEADGQVVGLAHFSFTHSSWAKGPNLFLEDLFVDKALRGQGIGKSLIEALDTPAKAKSSEKIYWETHKDNFVAKSLYEGLSQLSEFVTYSRAVK